MSEDRFAALEERLGIIENKLAIHELIASHPPSADTAYAGYTASVYFQDGIFDRGPGLDGTTGAEAIASFITTPAHEQAIRQGLAHFCSPPLIDLRGDEAVVTSYLLLLHIDEAGDSRELPNHGASTGYRVHRVLVNRWELALSEGRWKIRRRTLLPADGTDAPRELLAKGLSDVLSRHTSSS